MKNKFKRIFSAFLSMAVLSCTFPPSVVTTSAEEPVNYECDAKDITNIQNGVILHCFDWKYTDIIDELPNIAAAGFNAVQTSPAQPAVDYQEGQSTGIWWKLYQPLDFCIGTNWLGTKEELRQLCTEAHKYGIEVIVDIVSNHLASDHSKIAAKWQPEEYWHDQHEGEENYWTKKSNRERTTIKQLEGLPDIASENSYVQECVAAYVRELKSVGVDGLRWDTLKHIQVPSEDCAFFTTVLYEDMYSYGESLGDPGGNSESHNVALMQEYTGLMSVTDDVYGNGLRSSLASGNVSTSNGNWAERGMNANKLVYWGESHDTWSNDETGTTGAPRYTTNISQNVIDRTYALVASRADATSLYFSRPSKTKKDEILAGVKGSVHFKDAEVAAVNHFHNAFIGQSDHYATSGKIAYTERGKKGAVLVNATGGSAAVSVTAYRMLDGTYTDQVTGGQFTVSDGKILGTIGSTGIAVIYNPDDTEEPYIKNDTMYFKPNSKWKADNSRFAMYLWNDSESTKTWEDMSDPDGDGTYSASVPAGKWTGVIFCCMNGSNTENTWANKTYQTIDLFPDENTDRYTLRSGVGTETESTKGTWDAFGHIHSYGYPEWKTADDGNSVTATFTCSGCDTPFTATDSSPEVVGYASNVRKLSASVTGPDGKIYKSPVQYFPMVVQEEHEGGVEYQKANAELLNEIYEATMDHEEEINIYSYGLPTSEGAYITQALQNIYPELFFVNFFTYYYSGDTLYSIVPDYNMDKGEADEKTAEFYAKAEEYLSLIDDSMDDFTKALVLHDRLVLDHCYQIQSDTEYSSNYTFMIKGWGRCENYAEVYAYILARAGIKSEIIDGNAGGAHEWIKICLDGKWYNVDITFDDPTVNGSDRPNKASHKFFLASDTLIKDSAYHTTVHGNFTSNYASDTSYDEYDNLHGNDNPICYVNGELYTLYENDDHKGVIAVYNPVNDTYTDKYVIYDLWAAGSGCWIGNFSGIAGYSGLLYFNGEHDVNTYNPATGAVQKYCTYDNSQLYGMYIKDGQLYVLAAPNPNTNPTTVSLGTIQPTKYTVTWKNDDGTVLKTEQLSYGTTPSYTETAPEKAGNAQYTYTFTGWTPEITSVTGDAVYTAVYSQTVNKYTVTWKDDDGTVLKTEQLSYGDTPSYGTTPAKASTSEYSYTFKCWTPEITSVTGNAVYTAEYNEIPLSNTEITAYNFAGWDKVYIYYWGGTSGSVTWPGVEMTSADGENFKFTYSIPSDMKNIIFNNGDGKPQTADLSLTDGTEWNVSLTGTNVNAITTQTYYLAGDSINNWITDKDWDNNSQYKFEINKNASGGAEEYMLSVELPAGVHIKVTDTNGTMYPGEGTSSYKNISTDACYTIYFRPNANGGSSWHYSYFKAEKTKYTVAFSDGIDSQTVTYGECAAEPAQPSKDNYTFTGWYLNGEPYDFSTPVKSDITLTAQWKERAVNIQLVGISGNARTTLRITPKDNSFEDVSEQILITTPPYLDGYTFTGWNLDGTIYSKDKQSDLINALKPLIKAEPQDDIIVKEIYEQAETLYTVTVENGSVRNSRNDTTGNYKASDQIYVTATGGSPEQDFSYWTKQDEESSKVIVGYEETYAFRMPSKNTTLTAVYEGTKEKLGTAYIESVKKTDDTAISFVAVLSVPNDATMLRAGIVACKQIDLEKGHETPTIDYARFKRYNDTNCVNYKSFKYTWTKGNIAEGDTWCVCAYLLYKDKNNVEKTVYSNMVSASLSDNFDNV